MCAYASHAARVVRVCQTTGELILSRAICRVTTHVRPPRPWNRPFQWNDDATPVYSIEIDLDPRFCVDYTHSYPTKTLSRTMPYDDNNYYCDT